MPTEETNAISDLGCVIPDDFSQPGTHVLVIGVSRYSHGTDEGAGSRLCNEWAIGNLTSAARSAIRMADWLLRREAVPPVLPLASMRVLLSPIDDELEGVNVDPRLLRSPRADMANVDTAAHAFIEACQSNRNNHAVVYVVGHGVQVARDGAVLMLEDFGADGAPKKLHAALDMVSFYAALDHQEGPRHQFWFVDICRDRPDMVKGFRNLRVGVSFDEPDSGSMDSGPLLMSTGNGMKSFAQIGGLSVFCEALLWALKDGGAAVGAKEPISQWHITGSSLCERVAKRVADMAAKHNLEQKVFPGGNLAPSVFHIYSACPSVDLTVSLRPEEAELTSNLDLHDEKRSVVKTFVAEWPVRTQVEAGIYGVRVTNASYPEYYRALFLEPPAQEHLVKLS